MTDRREQSDLCANCLNIQHCFYNKREPVIFCEEFTCKDPGASVKDAERFNRAEAMFLPKTDPGIFDDCGQCAWDNAIFKNKNSAVNDID